MHVRTHRLKLILPVVAILVVSIIVFANYPSGLPWIDFGRPKGDQTIRITSLGKHPTPTSDWVEWISMTEKGNQFKIYVQERRLIIDRSWWNPFGKYSQTGHGTIFPIVDQWEITVRDVPRAVTYETESYRWWYEHADPMSDAIMREEGVRAEKCRRRETVKGK